MATKQVLFPHPNRGFAWAASEAPVLLNGMRVLFDEKVALYPVELEPELPREQPGKPGKVDSNGRNRNTRNSSRRSN